MLTIDRALLARSAALRAIRGFFQDRDFVEVDGSLLLPGVPPESFVDVFEVPVRKSDGGREVQYLPPSPEGALKRALALLNVDVFEIGHAFRDGENEGLRHRAHFRMVEWYRLNAPLTAVMEDTEALLKAIAAAVSTAPDVPDVPVDLAGPFERLTVTDAFHRYANVRLENQGDLHGLPQIVRDRGLADVDTWEDAFNILLTTAIEPHLGVGRPTFLTDYPAGLAPQARHRDDAPWIAEQFELWVCGEELGNSYSEVTDPVEQTRRFDHEAKRFTARGVSAPRVDPRYLDALSMLPDRVAGGSLGLDRTLMMLLGIADISGVRLG